MQFLACDAFAVSEGAQSLNMSNQALGLSAAVLLAGVLRANAQVRTLSETVRLDARTKLLNPKFYEGMLKSGYEGTREITKRLRHTTGWSATAPAVCGTCSTLIWKGVAWPTAHAQNDSSDAAGTLPLTPAIFWAFARQSA